MIITITRPAGNEIHLDGDVSFMEGIPFILTFDTLDNLLGVIALANRTVAIIRKALDQHLAYYRANGFQVTEVF